MSKVNSFRIPLNISKFVHFKVYILLIIMLVFSFFYLLLDDSHFSGLNTIQELIREEVIKRKIEKKVEKNVDTHIKDAPKAKQRSILDHIIDTPKIFENFTNRESMKSIIKDKVIDSATKKANREVENEDITIEKIRPSIGQKYFNRLYFAISTGCLLGYGDVYPVSNIAKLFSMMQALITVTLIVY